ncbi:MAG: hypothetical protein HGA22_14605, partial [Clostridiales bacterium]|nr:hypothetical protein [Clostridiales bacterium]
MKRGKTGRKPIYASGYLLLMLCVIICTQGFFFSRVNAEASTGFDLTSIKATSVIVTDTERGQVLMSRNKDEKLHISAACKLMTILIALENGDISSNVTIRKDT